MMDDPGLYDHNLKPGLIINIAFSEHLFTKAWWSQVEIPVAVNSDVTTLLYQSSAYAHTALSVRPYRSSCMVLTFNPSTFCVTFLFFNRDGLVTTPGYDISTLAGWHAFIRGVCGVFDWSFEAAGMEASRSTRLPFVKWAQTGGDYVYAVYEVERVFDRTTIERATLVEKYRLLAQGSTPLAATATARELFHGRISVESTPYFSRHGERSTGRLAGGPKPAVVTNESLFTRSHATQTSSSFDPGVASLRCTSLPLADSVMPAIHVQCRSLRGSPLPEGPPSVKPSVPLNYTDYQEEYITTRRIPLSGGHIEVGPHP